MNSTPPPLGIFFLSAASNAAIDFSHFIDLAWAKAGVTEETINSP